MSDSKTTSGSLGFFSLLGLAFIVLKLCRVIDWSWWLVLGPLWMPLAVVIVALLIWFPFWYFGKKKKVNKQLKEAKDNKSRWQQRLEEVQREQALKNSK
jgi:hypothetical protein